MQGPVTYLLAAVVVIPLAWVMSPHTWLFTMDHTSASSTISPFNSHTRCFVCSTMPIAMPPRSLIGNSPWPLSTVVHGMLVTMRVPCDCRLEAVHSSQCMVQQARATKCTGKGHPMSECLAMTLEMDRSLHAALFDLFYCICCYKVLIHVMVASGMCQLLRSIRHGG